MAIEEPMETDEAIIEGAREITSETKQPTIQSTEKYKVRIEKVNGWYGS